MQDTISIPNPLQSAALASPERCVLVDDEKSWTARALLRDVLRCAAYLQTRGVQSGDVIGLVGRADGRFAIVFHALGWLGAVAAPLASRGSAEEYALSLRVRRISQVVNTGNLSDDSKEALCRAAKAENVPVFSSGEGRLEDAPGERFWSLGEVRIVVETSGSTGTPRAIELTTAQLVFSAFGSAIRLGHMPGDRWLCVLPLHHVGGLSILVRCALYGSTAIVKSRFVAEEVASMVERGEAELISLVPQMLQKVLDAMGEASPHANLRAILLGGGAAPASLLEMCKERGVPAAITWGMTETASQVATCPPGEVPEPCVCGASLAFARVDAPNGLLRVRGPVAQGGEIVTRDRGTLGRNGEVVVLGRADDVIISGGENIDPEEVAQAILAHPGVGEVAVLGVPDARWGQRPAAVLVMDAEQSAPTPQDMKQWCRERLTPFKVPDHWLTRDALPRTSLGKLARQKLREDVLSELHNTTRTNLSHSRTGKHGQSSSHLEEGR